MSELLVVTRQSDDAGLRGRARPRLSRALARLCLRAARARAGAPPGRRADGHGAPLPCAGWSWSWAHTRGRVAAVTAPGPIGVDVEWLGRRPGAALAAAVPDAEARHLPRDDAPWRLRAWTAKEALLKALGVGLGGLSRCRLAGPPRRRAAEEGGLAWPVAFDGALRDVLQHDVGEHSLALATGSGRPGLLRVLELGADASGDGPEGREHGP